MDDREFVERLAAGDPGAFSDLVTQYVPRMLRYATRLLGSPEAAEDAVYELLAKWVKEPPAITGPVGPFLLRSVYNAVIDSERRRKKQTGQHPRTQTGVVAPDRRLRGALVTQQENETDEVFDEVCRQAYANLSPSDKNVLELSTRNMTTKEKADEMHKSVGAFNKHLHDARDRLVQAVEDARARRAQRT